jgi:methylthioribulose-1-phosphate dehydratase
MLDQTYTEAMRQLATDLARKGWLPATSGNLSLKVSGQPLTIAVTRSGADKQALRDEDVLHVDAHQQPLQSTSFKPSAETVVHTELYEALQCGAVVHVHTMHNNLLSELDFQQGYVRITEHELLKALNHWEVGASIDVPIVENFHDIPQLADAVRSAVKPGVPGVLVRRHGIYVWGKNAEEAKRFLEAFEFLFEYEFKRRQFTL